MDPLQQLAAAPGPGLAATAPSAAASWSDAVPAAALAGVGDARWSPETMMACFKIVPCGNSYSHDWKACPFLHPGERARRRPLGAHAYSAEVCGYIRNGQACPHGDACGQAHNTFEAWMHPDRFRTIMCRDGRLCARRVCFFAHEDAELRSAPPSVRARALRAAKLQARNGGGGGGSAAQRRRASSSVSDASSGGSAPASAGGSPRQPGAEGAGAGAGLLRWKSQSSLSAHDEPLAVPPSLALLWHPQGCVGGGAPGSSSDGGAAGSAASSPLSAAPAPAAADPLLASLLAGLPAGVGSAAPLPPAAAAVPSAAAAAAQLLGLPPAPYESWEEAAGALQSLLLEAEVCRAAAEAAASAADKARAAALAGEGRAAALVNRLHCGGGGDCGGGLLQQHLQPPGLAGLAGFSAAPGGGGGGFQHASAVAALQRAGGFAPGRGFAGAGALLSLELLCGNLLL
ncbi:hypothetical protein Rsub_03587 [Raphidocelis subcapitata]|uniref:C3H1-type domain-containing protein n=1 Tax=Raphidocelis subcapitata TaxID=307507 RepID=A0A2V0P241_9CHLO|nr:hypothetical protein Rsub_03587 [Raphidocelis subcapitata]|eukprot:GBF91267.1 hypothetical protein Rsub_03587 [Raphidocelis subcapitata]